jgi:hypothetical protein
MATCVVAGCERRRKAYGLCDAHYHRLWRHGSIDKLPPGFPAGDPAVRFWSRVDATGDCWDFMGKPTRAGYGQIGVDGRTLLAHRFSYELLVGPIPEELTLDHLCRRRICVNPDHLEVTELGVNVMRGYGACAQHARKTRCKRGHEFTEENTYRPPRGGRQCRACRSVREAAA